MPRIGGKTDKKKCETNTVRYLAIIIFVLIAIAYRQMPPTIFKDPKPVYLKAPRGRIVALKGPDVQLGKTLVANSPQRVRAAQLESTKNLLRKHLGKEVEIRFRVFATYPVTKKPDGTGMNQGKGSIDHFIARVPAGKTMIQLPGWLSPFSFCGFGPQLPFLEAFRKVAQKLPMSVTLRAQNNSFPMDRFDSIQRAKLRKEDYKTFNRNRQKLLSRSSAFDHKKSFNS